MTGTVLPARNTSGVVRAFRMRDVFVFNTLGFALGLVASLMPSFLALQQPRANILATLTIGFLVCILNGVLYAEIAGLMPRSGGDYVFLSRTLSPLAGFCANWGLTWSQLFGVGAYASWAVSTALGPAVKLIAQRHRSFMLDRFSGGISSSPIAVSIATVLLIVIALLLSLQGLSALRRSLASGLLIALIGTAIAGFSLYSHSPQEAQASVINALGAGGAGQGIWEQIQASVPAHLPPTTLMAALLSLPIGYWAYLGFTYSVYVGSEVSQPRKAQMFGILGSLVFGYAGYMLLLGRYYHLLGRQSVIAFAMAEKNSPQLLPVASSFMLWVGSIAPSGILGDLAIISFFLWYFLLLIVMIQVCARNIFAWSLDGIVPSWLLRVSSARAVPANSLALVCVIGAIFGILVSFGLINFVNYVALFVACYLLTGIAAALMPWLRRDLLRQNRAAGSAGQFAPVRIFILGICNTLAFAFILATALFSTDFSGVPATPWPTVFLILVYGVGVLVYHSVQRRVPLLDRELRLQLPPE